MSDAPPHLIADRYRIVEPLGQGGMGRVWKARDEVLHRDVAIKELVPPPGLTVDERREMRERSLREARAIARLNHINVVRVFDVLRTDGDPWIVMEYVPSRSLQDALAADGPVSPTRAAEIGLGVLGALRAAHRAGVMHRDVKPGNVLLGFDGRVVLTDFGLATVPGDPTVTRTGLVLGSPAYIAPERAREGTAGPEADLWSLGATLYAAVEGQSPYARPSAIATLAALATEPPPPARRAGPLKAVLNGLLRKDPASRIDADVAERLLRRAAGRGGRAGLSLFEGVRRPSPLGQRPERTRIVPLPTQRPPQDRPDPSRSPAPVPPPVPPTPTPPVRPSPPPVAPAAETTKLPAAPVSPPPAAETTKLPAPAAPPAAETTTLPGTTGEDRSGSTDGPVPATGADPRAAAARDADQERGGTAEQSGGPVPASGGPAAGRATDGGAPESAGSDGSSAARSGAADLTRRVAAAVPALAPALVGRARVVADRLRPGAAGDDDADRPLLSRTGWLVLALIAVLLLGTAIAVPLLRDAGDDGPAGGQGTGQPAGTPTAAASPTAVPTATAPVSTPTAAAPTTPPAGGDALGPPVLPPGWSLHRDPTGFQVPIPPGWTVTRRQRWGAADEVRVTFSGRDGRWLLIDQTNSPKPDPVADWRRQESARRGNYANYRRIRIESIDYWDVAADWEWTYSDDGARRTVNRGFVTARDKAYAIRWDTPAGVWGENLANLQVIADGFRPARS